MIHLTLPSLSLCTLATATLLLAPPSYATKWECGERSNLPLEGKNYCAAGDYRQADSKLKNVFDSLLEKHKKNSGNAKALNRAQNAYEEYRDQLRIPAIVNSYSGRT